MNLEDRNIRALLESEVVNSLLNNKQYFGTCIHHLEPKYFAEPGMKLLFNNIKDFFIEYGSIPSLKELILSFKDASKGQKELIRTAIKEVKDKSNINEDMLLEKTEYFIKDSIFSDAIILGAEALGEANYEKKLESFSLAEESVKISLNSDFGVLLDDIDKVYDEFQEKPGIKLGIKSFDKMIGSGFTPKTLHSVMAASGVGKSAAMTAFAVQFLLQKQDVVFISLEMSEAEVSKRIYANLYDIDIGNLPNVDKQVIKNKYNNIKGSIGQLVTKEFSAGSLTPLGLDGFLTKLKNEKGIYTPVVIIDYLGLMASDKMTDVDNSYSYFGSIAEELRAVAQRRNLVMFTPLQLNRSAVNNLEADQSALSESMKILMTLDSAFILSQTPEMKDQGKMKVNFVKNRMSGKTWSFEIGFNYQKFRFDDRFFMGDSNITEYETKDPLSDAEFNTAAVDNLKGLMNL